MTEGAPVRCMYNSAVKVRTRQSVASSRYSALEPKPRGLGLSVGRGA